MSCCSKLHRASKHVVIQLQTISVLLNINVQSKGPCHSNLTYPWTPNPTSECISFFQFKRKSGSNSLQFSKYIMLMIINYKHLYSKNIIGKYKAVIFIELEKEIHSPPKYNYTSKQSPKLGTIQHLLLMSKC